MLEKVREYVKQYEMLKKEDRVILGVSGGADSVCLLFVLLELQKTIGFEMVVVHVNHGLRGTVADEEQAYVENLCKKEGIPFESYLENVALIAKNRKQSTEEAGREVRRACFQKAMKQYKGTKIALAHHQNDSAETFFMNVARGTGLKGLGGIRPIKGIYIRPLLCVNREEIESYLKARAIHYCEDMSNQSDCYTRNRIRNHVIPYMEQEVNQKTVAHVQETMEYLWQVQEYLESQCFEWEQKAVQKVDGGYEISKEIWLQMPRVLQTMLLRKVLAKVAQQEKDLESAHVRQLEQLLEKQSGREIHLPYEMIGTRTYEGITIRKKLEQKKMPEIVMEESCSPVVFGEYEIRWKKYEKVDICHDSLEKSNTKCFDCDIIKSNIIFRTRKPGDYITIHEDGRTQKLKSYFINEKIPKEKRDEILLVADGSHILWIVGYRVDLSYQAKKHTKHVLEIQIERGENYGRNN